MALRVKALDPDINATPVGAATIRIGSRAGCARREQQRRMTQAKDDEQLSLLIKADSDIWR